MFLLVTIFSIENICLDHGDNEKIERGKHNMSRTRWTMDNTRTRVARNIARDAD